MENHRMDMFVLIVEIAYLSHKLCSQSLIEELFDEQSRQDHDWIHDFVSTFIRTRWFLSDGMIMSDACTIICTSSLTNYCWFETSFEV